MNRNNSDPDLCVRSETLIGTWRTKSLKELLPWETLVQSAKIPVVGFRIVATHLGICLA